MDITDKVSLENVTLEPRKYSVFTGNVDQMQEEREALIFSKPQMAATQNKVPQS